MHTLKRTIKYELRNIVSRQKYGKINMPDLKESQSLKTMKYISVFVRITVFLSQYYQLQLKMLLNSVDTQ